MQPLSSSAGTLGATAMGRHHADLILTSCSLASVYTGEVLPDIQVAVSRGRIAYVGPDASHARGPHTAVMDIEGKYLAPGLADAHVHIDQFVLPSELAKRSLLHGTTALFSDPIDVTSAAGYAGFKELLKMTRRLPMRIFHTVPGGLPVDPRLSTARGLTVQQERAALREPDVVGLGEVFSWTKVTERDPPTMRKLEYALEHDCIINGHTAGASGKKLAAYAASGIHSCHEPISYEQALERLRLGMWVMAREGSIRRDLKDIVSGIIRDGMYSDRLMFCSDGLDPFDLDSLGHMDYCAAQAVQAGMSPVRAIACASRNCFDYYSMSRDLGGIAPGRLADMIITDDLENPAPSRIFVGGKLVASDGKIVSGLAHSAAPAWMRQTVRASKLTAKDFEVKAHGPSPQANTIVLATEIVTRLGTAELDVQNGLAAASPEREIFKAAALDRSHGAACKTVAFLEGFGGDIGGFASTWSFHENCLVVIGACDEDMALAANEACRDGGGMAAASRGRITASMPLQAAGIMSTDPFERAADAFGQVASAVRGSGCRLAKPHLALLFLPFLAIPAARLLPGGLVDVKARSYVRPLA